MDKYVVCTRIYKHTHREILLSHKKDELSPFATTWMELEGVILSEISRERQIPFDYTQM